MYKLKKSNGGVNAILKTGKDFVKTNVPSAVAQRMIDSHELMKSDLPDYPIHTDNGWYFEGVEIKEQKENE